MEYYSDVKKEENFTLCDSMDGPGVLSEISQLEKDKYHMITHIWNIMNKQLPGKRGQTHI